MVTTMRDKEVFLLVPGDNFNNPGEHHPAGQGSILVVEDDAPTLRLERVLLEEEGYSVEVVSSGEEAIEAISTKKPALVLLDIGLPGMDGFTTCQHIREVSRVPIIMVTGRDCLDDKVNGMNVGADDYVTKPFLTHELATRVKVLLRRARLENGASHNSNGAVHSQFQPASAVPQASSNDIASSHQSENGNEPVISEEVTSSQRYSQEEGLQTSPVAAPEATILQAPAPPGENAGETDLYLFSGAAPEPAEAQAPAPPTAGTPEAGLNSSSEESSGLVISPGPVPSPATPDSDAVYEGTVRLTVSTSGSVGHLINFVSELRQNSRFRLLRLVANPHKEGMDIWLGLREPLPLESALSGMNGVSQVNVSPETSSASQEPVFNILLR